MGLKSRDTVTVVDHGGVGAVAKPERGSDRVRSVLRSVVLPLAVIAATAGLMFVDGMPREVVGALALALVLVLMVLGMPIGAAMAVPSVLGIWAILGWRPLVSSMEGVPFQGVAGWSLSVIPMFIFMGIMLSKSGVTNQLYNGARAWLGWLPGGLAFTTNVAATGLNAATGSTIGTAYALGRIAVPEMLDAGYDKKYTLHAVLMGGLGAHLIPPSILLVVYAGIAETPVGPQLLAGMVPGLFLVVMFSIQVVVLATLFPRLTGGRIAGVGATWSERWGFARTAWPLPLLILVVLGGLYLGVFTPTEAGAFGALGASLLGLVFLGRRAFGPALRATLTSTVTSTAAIFFVIIGALYLTRLLALSGLARWAGDVLAAIDLTRVPFLLLLVVVFLVLGTFLDGLAMTLISVPILLPIVMEFGVDPIWFGVFVVFMAELAAISPPIGILVFVIHGLAQDPEVNRGQKVSLQDVWRAAYWLIPITLVVLVVLILFPEIVTWLPSVSQ